MKLCPYCQKAIPVRAVKCPACASSFDGMQMEEGRKQHSRRRSVTLWLSLAVLLAVLWSVGTWISDPAAIQAMAERDAERESR